MERLQAALEKARTARAQSAGGREDRRAAPRDRTGQDAATVEEAWQQLRRLEVKPAKLRKRRLFALFGGGEATAYDVLRTKVVQLTEANGWRRIAITSPLPGSGKTTTSLNLAISLARQVDLKVILIDLDLRRPAIARTLGHEGTGNVADLLEGRASFRSQAIRMGDNLAIAMNHAGLRDPSDLLLRKGTSEVIDSIEQTYQPDLMLFDLPPLLVNDDAQAFLPNVDCGLLIAEAGKSTIAQVDICEKEMAEQTNVLGVVLNKCRFHADGYAHYAYDYSYS